MLKLNIKGCVKLASLHLNGVGINAAAPSSGHSRAAGF